MEKMAPFMIQRRALGAERSAFSAPRSALNPEPRRAALRAGFSLVEIMIVVAIISLLLTIVAVSGVKIRESARTDRARNQVQAAQSAVEEYFAVVGKYVNAHQSDSPPAALFDWTENKPRNTPGATGSDDLSGPLHERSIERFAWAALQIESVETVLRSVGRDALVDQDGNGFLEVRDPWGNKLLYADYVHPDQGDQPKFLPYRGTETSKRPYVASPGPDGLWGNANTPVDENNDGTPDHEDNLYSYEVE